MLNVVVVQVGDKYTDEYVDRMRHMVKRHLKMDHNFIVLGNDQLDVVPASWWHKIRVFSEDIPGQILYLDLDQIILKPLDDLLDKFDPDKLTCYRDHIDWHGCKFGSAFMYFPGGKFNKVFHNFLNLEYIERIELMIKYDKIGGDQRFIYDNMFHGDIEYMEDKMGYRPVLSYKFDGLDDIQRIPDGDTYIVNFHGVPKPHQIIDKHKWISDNWR